MKYKVFLDNPADKSLGKIIKNNKQAGQKILSACFELESFLASSRDIKRLQTPFDGFRKRVGKYRILFVVNKKVIEIYKIGLRKDIYKI